MGSDSENESKQKKGDSPKLEYAKDLESTEQKLPYPKAVFFIVTNEFCERFSYYGMRAVLILYLNTVLGFTEDTATVIYHVFTMLCYFTPLFGAMLADSFLGKFRTIFYLSLVYAIGNVVLSVAATPPISGNADVALSMIGLALIAIGTGGIKPCVAAFGGDQFVLPQQALQLASFFSFFYMAINAGSLLSTIITPIMRADVQCFDQDACYTLAFSVPAALMIVSLIVFLAGKFLYRETKPTGNVVVKVVKCISHALSRKRKTKGKREHWLDNADDDYEPRFIEDVKILLRVLLLYLPLPVFWALFDQQGSRWTLQATRMDGVVAGYTIKPDQIQVLNPALILIFIPLFDIIIYPLLSKCRLLKKPLQRLTVGGVLAGIAFIVSGVVEIQLESTYPNPLATNQANLNFLNTLPCNITLNYDGADYNIEPNQGHVFRAVEATQYQLYTETSTPDNGIPIQLINECNFNIPTPFVVSAVKTEFELTAQQGTEEAESGGSFTYMITHGLDNTEIKLAYSDRSDDREKPQAGNPKLRFLLGAEYFESTAGETPRKVYVSLYGGGVSYVFEATASNNTALGDGIESLNYAFSTDTLEVEPVVYEVFLVYGEPDPSPAPIQITPFELRLGGSYIVTISKNGTYSATNPTVGRFDAENYNVVLHTLTEPSTLHMAWLLPQYIIITAGEIMFSITGLEFSYSQAPVSMKSVMQSAWLLTVAFGNLIVVIIAEAKFFSLQSNEFFLFAGLMFVDMILFAFMAYRYVPAQLEDPTKKKQEK